MKSKTFLTKVQLAMRLHVSGSTIDRWMKAGVISYTKIGNRVLFDETIIELLLVKQQKDEKTT
jgi:excisionase family DNA binding protein